MNINTYWHKRVPVSMVVEYLEKGWRVHEREGSTVVLVWPHEGAPE